MKANENKEPKAKKKPKSETELDVNAAIVVTKSFAQRMLRRAFNEARFQTVTTPDDRKAGIERWHLWLKGSYGRLTPLLEVAGKVAALPAAAVIKAYETLGLAVKFSHPVLIPPKVLALMTTEQVRQAKRRPSVTITPIKKKLEKPEKRGALTGLKRKKAAPAAPEPQGT